MEDLILPSALQDGETDSFRLYHCGSSGPLIVLLHGGGHTSLSWAIVARHLKSHAVRVLAYDAVGHGSTRVSSTTANDFSQQRQVADLLRIVHTALRGVDGQGEADAKAPNNSQQQPTSVVLVGHSMGGAIAVRAAATRQLPSLAGLLVLDAVEGPALASLPNMRRIVGSIPRSFPSPKAAVDWAVQSQTVSNRRSAAVSVPSQIEPNPSRQGAWRWRLDLMLTEPYWDGWFRGLSRTFLAVPCPKVLVSPGSDRLDNELMIAHMQGKFQLSIVAGSGHIIEEDQPEEVASIIVAFVVRHGLIGSGPSFRPSFPPR
eukprot:GHVT01074365.1.p1 GENE.GHVT01074365.1~~GHVT01074365.1.p1  ORF type:complete len:316 (-),score=64.03 GHVT01074365.1:1229-2176(-)